MHAPDFQTGIFAGLWVLSPRVAMLGGCRMGRPQQPPEDFESSIAVTEYICSRRSRRDIMRRSG